MSGGWEQRPTYGWGPQATIDPGYAAIGQAGRPAYAPHLPAGWQPEPRWPRWSRRPHPEPRDYLHLLRTRHHRWWKSVLGLLLAAAVWFGLNVVAVIGVLIATGGDQGVIDALGAGDLSDPGALLVGNLILAAFIPAVWVAVLLAHQERIGWLSSVVRRLRWRLIGGYAGLATALLALNLGASFLLPADAGGIGAGTAAALPSVGTLVAIGLVVALTTPFQAAAEEYLFRGYLAQVIGSWIPPRIAAAVVSALVTATLFAIAHGEQDAWLFADRFAFGLTASAVVLLTGGLEAAIAFHAANNVAVFAVATLTGSLDAAAGTSAPPLLVALDIAMMTAFVAATWWWTRRRPSELRSVPDGGVPALLGAVPGGPGGPGAPGLAGPPATGGWAGAAAWPGYAPAAPMVPGGPSPISAPVVPGGPAVAALVDPGPVAPVGPPAPYRPTAEEEAMWSRPPG